ncbi:MAG: class I SAM-dependent methyltransferase [Acidobacteria bacterium]|nr:class I SAM-dependent methyltransferase [Acidobacteriota bacterium]
MRIGIIPERLTERLMLGSRRFPRPLFDVMGTMLFSRALMAGVHFGLFDRLRDAPKTPEELAEETGCNRHGLKLLLDALVACDYLERDAGRYRNSRLAARWLLSDSPQSLANFVRYNYDQWEWVSELEQYIEHGEARDIHQKLTERAWRSYMLGVRDLATLSADEVTSRLHFPTPPHRLLDIGAGHCHYSVTLCRRYPTLRATVVDLEPAARIGQELVAQAGLAERFEFRVGNLADTPFGQGYDLALLFNVVHHLDEKTNRDCFARVHTALEPGGQLAVWESFREEREKQEKDQLGSLLGLFFGLVSRREAYEFEQVAGWAREAGFATVRRRRLRTAPFASLLIARKEEARRS